MMTGRTKSATAIKAPTGKCIDQLDVRFDVARDIISQYFAMTASQLAAEKESKSPNPEKIGELEVRLKGLYQEKMQLSPDNTELINKAYTAYAQIVKDPKA